MVNAVGTQRKDAETAPLSDLQQPLGRGRFRCLLVDPESPEERRIPNRSLRWATIERSATNAPIIAHDRPEESMQQFTRIEPTPQDLSCSLLATRHARCLVVPLGEASPRFGVVG